MVGDRKSHKVKAQILVLYGKGIGKKRIAQILGISKNTVKGVVRGGNSEPALVVSGETSPEPGKVDWALGIDWEKVRSELGHRYATIKCLHVEHAPAGVDYLRFWRELKRRIPTDPAEQARIRFQYKPGQRVEIDYCDGIPITDRKTGATKKTHLFAGVSAFSDYTFGEFSMTQKREEFIQSQERMHHFYGGVFKYLVVDNLKSGVAQAHIYDPDVNPVYIDYANHMGFAVLPARPRTPRDKPAIEGNIGVIQRQFFAETRNRVFYSLSELNVCFREYLKRLNGEVMKDYGVTRAERFTAEKSVLKPLPSEPFELAEYRAAKVHPDCHIQVEKNFYSVPYRFIGQSVRVRLTPRLLEIFNGDHQSIAVHSKLNGIGQFSTIDSHYPEQKLATARFDIVLAKREAERSGPEMQKLVEMLLTGDQPLRYLRRIQGILRLKKLYSSRALEYASHQAMLFSRLRLAYITDCAKKFELSGYRPRVVGAPERDPSSVYLQSHKPEETHPL
jgi:transposase